MSTEPTSPLAAMRWDHANPGVLPMLDLLGAAMDLLRHTEWQGRQPIGPFVLAVSNALRTGRAHVALTLDHRPFGLALWHHADTASHQQRLQGPPPQFNEILGLQGAASGPLWFSTLLIPFTSPLPLVLQLRERHAQAPAAWATCPDRPAVRRIW